MSTALRSAVIALVAICAISAGWYFGQQQRSASQPPQLAGATILPEPRDVEAFSLTDQDGTELNLDRFRDQWTFVYLGYTFCPDVCPVTLAELGRVDESLRQQESFDDVQYLFVSVDPKRDTPERLKEYVEYFGTDFMGATGDSETLESFATNIGQVFKVPEDPQDDNYLVDHSSVVALFAPTAKLYAVFTSPHSADAIEDGFRQIRNYYGG